MTTREYLENLEIEIETLGESFVEFKRTVNWEREEYQKRIDELERRIRALEIGHTNDPLGMRGV